MNGHPVVVLALIALSGLTGTARAEVKTVRVVQGGEVPEVVLDARGILHLTYGMGKPNNHYAGYAPETVSQLLRRHRSRLSPQASRQRFCPRPLTRRRVRC